MDLYRIIQELAKERDNITRVIESLESVNAEKQVPPKTRGRKSMDSAARKEVSERMRRYWAKRRQERDSARDSTAALSVQTPPHALARSAKAGMGTPASLSF